MYQNFKSFLRQSRYKFIDKGRGYLSKKYAEKFFCHFFYFERERDGERQKGGGRGGTEGGEVRGVGDVFSTSLAPERGRRGEGGGGRMGGGRGGELMALIATLHLHTA